MVHINKADISQAGLRFVTERGVESDPCDGARFETVEPKRTSTNSAVPIWLSSARGDGAAAVDGIVAIMINLNKRAIEDSRFVDAKRVTVQVDRARRLIRLAVCELGGFKLLGGKGPTFTIRLQVREGFPYTKDSRGLDIVRMRTGEIVLSIPADIDWL